MDNKIKEKKQEILKEIKANRKHPLGCNFGTSENWDEHRGFSRCFDDEEAEEVAQEIIDSRIRNGYL